MDKILLRGGELGDFLEQGLGIVQFVVGLHQGRGRRPPPRRQQRYRIPFQFRQPVKTDAVVKGRFLLFRFRFQGFLRGRQGHKSTSSFQSSIIMFTVSPAFLTGKSSGQIARPLARDMEVRMLEPWGPVGLA